MNNQPQIADSDVENTIGFFKKAFPNPISKNLHTQLGVHFEEIAEMMDQLTSEDEHTRLALHYVGEAIKGLAKHFKESDGVLVVKDRVELLDALCDQIVTATGMGYMTKMDIAGAFGEVNRSNFSKFDENGEPILDNNLKMVKGPNYFKPNLKQYT